MTAEGNGRVLNQSTCRPVVRGRPYDAPNRGLPVSGVVGPPAPRVAGLAVILGVLAFVFPLSSDAAYILLKNNRKIEGEGLRRNAQGQFVIETAAGIQTYDPRQIVRAEADRPADYSRGVQLFKARKYDEALKLFEALVRKFEGLTWDHRANLMIARTYAGQGRADAALATFKLLPESAFKNPDVRLQYWDVLMETAEYETLAKDLKEAVRDKNRDIAGRAQLVRGNMRMRQKQYERAAINYLRTVEFFQADRELRAEALFRAAAALDELRDQRAEGLRQELRSRYPDSEWAGRRGDG